MQSSLKTESSLGKNLTSALAEVVTISNILSLQRCLSTKHFTSIKHYCPGTALQSTPQGCVYANATSTLKPSWQG